MKNLKYILLLLLLQQVAFAQNTTIPCPEDLVPKYDKQKKMWGFANLFGQWVLEPIYTKVTPFVEDKAVVQKGLLYGVIACDGEVIVPNTYQNMTSYRAGKIWALKNRLWGVLDHQGKTLLDFKFQEINPIVHTALTWVKNEQGWGLFDEEKGRLICKPQFAMATIMSPNASLVKVDSLYGVVNHVNGAFLIAPEISKVKKVATHMIVFKQKSKWGLFNEYGILRLNPEFDSLYMKYPETVVGIKNKKYGLYDLSGKEMLPLVYDDFGTLNEGLFSFYQNGYYGYATRQGKIIAKPEYQSAMSFKNKLAVTKKNNLYGVIDFTNKWKLEPKFEDVQRNYSTGEFAVKLKDKPYFIYSPELVLRSTHGFDSIYINDNIRYTRVKLNGEIAFINLAKGEKIFENQYDNALPFEHETSKVSNHKLWGIINTQGQELLGIKYDSITPKLWGNKKVWQVWSGNICGIFDTTGKVILPSEYEFIDYTGNGLLKVKKNKKWAVIKTNGTTITAFMFDDMSISKALPAWPAVVQQDNKYGLLADNGQLVLPMNSDHIVYLGQQLYKFKKGNGVKITNAQGLVITKSSYDQIDSLSNNRLLVLEGKKWGWIDNAGLEIVKPKYDAIQNCKPNYCLVSQNQKWGILDKKGSVKIPANYDAVELKDGKIYLIKNDKPYLIDSNGSLVAKK